MSDLSLKDFIADKLSVIEKKLDAITENTNRNNESIVRLQTLQEKLDTDLTNIQSLNREQHKEFYDSIKEINKKISEADLIKLKETVDADNTRLDNLWGAFKIVAVLGGVFAFVVGTFIALG